MSAYSIILTVHLIAAVVGLGATFGIPVLTSKVKTASHAKLALNVSLGLEKYGKIGSLTLLATGIIMGILNPHLFTQIWFIASLVIYIAVQPVAAGLLPKKAKLQAAALESHQGEDLPEAYEKLAKESAPLNNVLLGSAIVLIVLMTIKPF